MSAGSRLMAAPVFLLSAPRSGSTLLRCLLDSHSQIRSPHELHLKYLRAQPASEHCRVSLELLGYPAAELTYLLWDRLLHEELRSSGKRVLVEKSPCNVDIVNELWQCWPDARFIMLLRYPPHAARSLVDNFAEYDLSAATRRLALVDDVLSQLRSRPAGVLSVRYEDLAASTAETLRQVCGYLRLAFEPAMLDYGRQDHGPFAPGLGDWGERIRSGVVLPERAVAPVPLTPALAAICRSWGYDTPAAGR